MTDKLTIADCRKAGFCVSGCRRFAPAFGIDFRSFIRNGVDLEEAAQIPDLNMQRAVKVARARIAKEKGDAHGGR